MDRFEPLRRTVNGVFELTTVKPVNTMHKSMNPQERTLTMSVNCGPLNNVPLPVREGR